jgi:hypothetical protein
MSVRCNSCSSNECMSKQAKGIDHPVVIINHQYAPSFACDAIQAAQVHACSKRLGRERRVRGRSAHGHAACDSSTILASVFIHAWKVSSWPSEEHAGHVMQAQIREVCIGSSVCVHAPTSCRHASDATMHAHAHEGFC